MSETYSLKEKENIFITRTKAEYPDVWKHYTTHVAHELMTEDEIHSYNFKERVRVAVFAYENIAFYRRLYDRKGIDPRRIKTEEDWLQLPTVDKQMLREDLENVVLGGFEGDAVKKYGRCLATGGSTGVPLSLVRDMRHEQAGSTTWRSRGWWLGRPLGELVGDVPVLGQDEGIIWRAKGVNTKNSTQREQEKASYYPMKKMYLDAQDMSNQNMRRFAEEILSSGVVFLRGYAGAMVEFASFCLANHIDCRPKAVSVVSSPIDPLGRRIIRDAFDCAVFDVYGSSEVQNIAIECKHSHNHLHVLSDLRHLEILDNSLHPCPAGVDGSVFVTSFTNYLMPLIRYRLGDKTHWVGEVCECGLPFPLVNRVTGRELQLIKDKDGRPVFAPHSSVYAEAESVLGYQFVVHGDGVVTIKMVPNKRYFDWEAGVNRIRDNYTKEYENRIDFDYQLVDSIPHDDGKQRFIVFDWNNRE